MIILNLGNTRGNKKKYVYIRSSSYLHEIESFSIRLRSII